MRVVYMRRAVWIAAALVLFGGLAALAETVYVKSSSTLIFEDKNPYKKQRTRRIFYAQKVERLSDDGRWSRVRVAGGEDGALREGFVRSGDLSKRRPERTSLLTGKKRSDMTSADSVLTAGSRQLGPLGSKYAQEHNLQEGQRIVEQVMDAMAPDYAKLQEFQRQGRVGDYAVGEVAK